MSHEPRAISQQNGHCSHLFLISVLVVILLLFSFSLSVKGNCAPVEKQITVVFRFDDYSSLSSTDIEVKLIDVFKKQNICCTFGVIPYVCTGDCHKTCPQDITPLTPAKAGILNNAIKAGVLEVALHGYFHQTIRERADGGHTEFFGLNYNSQVKKIAKGKDLLEKMLDTQVTTFIPPWNSYDLNTMRALKNLRFKCISAGTNVDVKEFSPLTFLPATCDLLRLRNAVESARHIPDIQAIIIVLFHEYDFLEIDRERGSLTYQEFVRLLDWLTSQKDIHVRSINQTTKVMDDLSIGRFIDYISYFKLCYLIPPLFQNKLCPVGVYLSSDNIFNMKIKLWVFILFFYLVTLVISIIITFFAGFIVFPKSGLVVSISKYGGPVLLVLLLIYVLRDLVLGYKGALAIVVLLGACIGAWSSFLKLRKQNRLRQVR